MAVTILSNALRRSLVLLLIGIWFPSASALWCIDVKYCKCDQKNTTIMCSNFEMKEIPTGNAIVTTVGDLSITETGIKIIRNYSFIQYPNLSKVTMSSNKISFIEDDAFKGLKNLRVLDLSQNRITSLSANVFEGLMFLSSMSLRFNRLKRVDAVVWKHLSGLINLRISGNQFTSAEDIGLAGLINLRILFLQFNRLKSFNCSDFSDARFLQNLHLSANFIQEINPENMNCQIPLSTLELDGNRIRYLRNGTFASLSSLKILNLAFNSIYSMEVAAFSDGHKLRNLYMSNNKLKILDGRFFKRLPRLRIFYARNNQIHSIINDGFKENSRMGTIILTSNNLKEVAKDDFANLKSLIDLNLSENNISKIDYRAFEGLSNLKRLRLNGNPIGNLSMENLKDLSSLENLELKNIPNLVIHLKPFSAPPSGPLKFYLTDSIINFIDEMAFANFSAMEYLNMGSTGLRYFPNTLLSTNQESALKELYLYQNLIESLQSNSFHGLTKLQKLYLDDNFLTRICNSSFDTLTALDTLMIRNNNMTHLSEYQFSGMPNVLRISLSSNQLCCIHPNTFANLTRLTSLDLSDNVISDIQGFQIPDLKALTLLMLNENQISKVLNGSFSGLKSLKKLVLRTNRISYIAHAAFEGLIQIQDIRLDGNWIVSVAIDIFSTGAPLINYVGLSKNKIKSVQLINTSFSLIQHLDLSHNVIRKSIILSGNNLQKLNLSANRIDHVSELKNLNLSLFDSIDFSNNRILDINNQIIPNTQEFPKIRALYIKSNKLNQIHQRAFQNLQNLEILDLQNNNIRVLSFAENLRSLEKLIMGKNKIQQLKSQYFQNLTNLTELDVSCNQIRRLENHMFKSLTKLKSLKLSGNRIELIKTQAFNGLIALTNLQLEYNLIQSIDGIFKNHLQNLQTLNISNNKITSIGGSSFLSMSYLEQLWLDNNQIPSLPTNSFNGLSSLIIISLSENLIGNLSCESFTNLNQLDELRLASNNISFIHHNCASVFSRLNKIDFNFNNLVRNGINISNSILDSLSGFPFELKLAGNNIKHLQTSYFRQNILLRSIDIGYNELNDEEMAGLISSIIILNEECQSFKKIFRCYEYSINVAGNNMHSIPPGFFNYLKEFILKINITNNKLQTVDASEIFSSHDYILQELYISNNRIQYFTNFKKLQFYKLRILNIDNNNIADICQKNLGRTWPNLEYLSANKNNIKVLQSRCFQYSSKLKFISLKENPINSLNPRSFYGPPILDTVLSTRDYLCCYVPAQVTFCTPIYDQDALSTCDDMLSHPTLQYFVWIIGITAFVGNILVFLHYCQQSKQKHPPISVTTVLLTNLALADFFMSIYLIIIGIADQIYRGYYSMYVEPWLTSVPCYSASFLVSLSSLMSVYMMIIISIDRFICITFPFSTKRLKVSSARNVLLVGWLFCIVFAGIPVVFSIGKPGESRLYKYSSICMPSNVNNVYYRTWILCYTFLTMVAWILTCALYFGMFFSMRQSSKSVRKIGSVNRDRKIAIRLFLIIITDLASWMPYYILVIQVLFTGTIDIIVLQFVIIFALPINSAINPYLYTITNLSTFNKAFSQVVPSGVQQAITNIRSTELTRQGSEISRRQREFNLSHATRSDSVTPRKSISVILLDEKQSSNLIVDQTPVGQGIFKEVEFGYSDTLTNISGQTVKHGLHHITPRRNDPSSITNIH